MAVATLFPLVRTENHSSGGKGKPLPRPQLVEPCEPYVAEVPVRNDLSKCAHGVYFPKGHDAPFCTLCSPTHVSHLLSLSVDPRGILRFCRPRNQVAYANGHSNSQVCPQCACPMHYVPDPANPLSWQCADCSHEWEGRKLCKT